MRELLCPGLLPLLGGSKTQTRILIIRSLFRGGGRYGRGGKFSRNRDNDSGRGRQNKYRKY